MRSLSTVVVAALMVAACSGADSRDQLVVATASSLAEAFAQMEAEFEAAYPDIDVALNVAGSSLLREQILSGAPIDVFASADLEDMDRVVEAGLAEAPTIFATNRMAVAVAANNPGGVEDIGDLASEGLLVGTCEPQVPCGRLADELLERAGVTASVDTQEPNVRALTTKLSLGELDAAIVYLSDVHNVSLGNVSIPESQNPIVAYPIAVVLETARPDDAQAFVDFVLTEGGRIMLAYGFGGA